MPPTSRIPLALFVPLFVPLALGCSDHTPLERDDQGVVRDGDVSPTDGDVATSDGEVSTDGGAGAFCDGYATRYWDCCKAHCGWAANVPDGVEAITSCDATDAPLASLSSGSACDTNAPGPAHTCYDNAPWAVSSTLAYGFAAVPANGDICGRCYELQFTGEGHYQADDPGSVALLGKRMIVQATNIGYDVAGGQFDVLIPGGGVGLFDACSDQWGVTSDQLGATYGGFLTSCREAGGDHAAVVACVEARCTAVFDAPNQASLLAGCQWFTSWYEAADNPNLRYREVDCPAALVSVSGIERGPAGATECSGSEETCDAEAMAACDCAWTNGGANCGTSDGSCCWTACCGG